MRHDHARDGIRHPAVSRGLRLAAGGHGQVLIGHHGGLLLGGLLLPLAIHLGEHGGAGTAAGRSIVLLLQLTDALLTLTGRAVRGINAQHAVKGGVRLIVLAQVDVAVGQGQQALHLMHIAGVLRRKGGIVANRILRAHQLLLRALVFGRQVTSLLQKRDGLLISAHTAVVNGLGNQRIRKAELDESLLLHRAGALG